MATSVLPQLSFPASELANPSSGLPKSSFLSNCKLLYVPNSRNRRLGHNRVYKGPCASANPFDPIPKQFTEENLKDGLMDNYKNVPSHLYGLSPSQLDMFMTEDNPFRRLSEKVTEESISVRRHYGGMYSLSGMKDTGSAKYSMGASMYRGGARRFGRPRSPPPDLPSMILDGRIVYIAMPLVPAVTELIIAQLIYLERDDPTKPIYLYINSTGTQNQNMETVGSEAEAYAIADYLALIKSRVYTVNCGMAYGQAAMLLSLGSRGCRCVLPNSFTKLYLPDVYRSSGAATDMWIKAKELDVNIEYYIELLAIGTGKSKEEINKDLQRSQFFSAQEAIEYGLADKIIKLDGKSFGKQDFEPPQAQSRAMRAARAGPRAATSGYNI